MIKRMRGGDGRVFSYGTALIHLLFLILGFGEPIKASLSSASKNCSFEPSKEILKCSVESLRINSTNSGRYSKASVLEYFCSNIYSLESPLRPGHFGRLPTLEELKVEGCRTREIPGSTFSGLNGLSSLTFVSGGSLEIKEVTAFAGLESLRVLNLSRNNIWTLPAGVFCPLGSLRALDLSYNKLQDLTELSLSESSPPSCKLPLEKINLSENSYSEFPSRALSQLSKLEVLFLSRNGLNLVQDDAFENLRNLKILDLSDNRLIALPPDTFFSTPNIREIHLQNNSLRVLAPKIFSGLERLLVLNVSRNELGAEWLTGEIFKSCVRLVSLDLSYNRLSYLNPDVLRPLNSLQILDLSRNRLSTLDAGTFSSQNNLHILRLNSNLLKNLHPRSLDGLSVLSSLNADHNQLSVLDETAFSDCCGSLSDLTLGDNEFSRVPDGLRKLGGLKTLDLGGNSIQQLHNESFTGLTSLYGLKLSSNGIRSVKGSIFKSVSGVQVLNLAHNKIKELDQGVFNSLPSLKMLRLDGNELRDINGLLSGQEELQWLNVSANKLQWFDYAFIPKNLEWLDIHGNQIEDLGNYYKLTNQFELRTLDASRNKIEKLGPLSFPESLQVAILSHNRVRSIAPVTFLEKTQIRKVDLSHNQIKRLQISSFNIKPESPNDEGPRPHFYLGHNPLHCDCEIEWFKKMNEMTQSRLPLVMDYPDIRCSGGGGSSVADIPDEHFLCQYEAHCFSLCMCCEFFACDCRMQCPEGCDCYHDISWSVNVIQCSKRNHGDIPPLIPMDATDIYMDGNNFTGLLDSQSFIGRKRISTMFLNNSRIGAVDNQTFNGLTELKVLHLEDNLIKRLEGYEFLNLTSLIELYLQRNRIEYLNERTFENLIDLRVLRLDGNELVSYPIWELPGGILPELASISVSNNPWSCQCDFVQRFQEMAFEKKETYTDLNEVSCLFKDGYTTVSLARNLTCSESMAVVRRSPEDSHSSSALLKDMIPLAIIASAVFVIIAMTFAVLFAFRTPLRVWLHSKYGIRVFDSKRDVGGGDKLYDAFMSYSLKDEEFVHTILLPQLENRGGVGYKFCLQHRDLPSNSSITDTFPSVSQLCSRHLLIVSKNYLETEWTQIKFSIPKKWRPVLILIEELSSLDLAAAPEFILMSKSGPLVKWGETGFWNKLRFYLPDADEYRTQEASSPAGVSHDAGNVKIQYPAASGWHYDGLIMSNNSSSTSTRSTVAGGSPRTTGSSEDAIQILNNPLENVRQWNPSSSVADPHAYQSIGGVNDIHLSAEQQHIYHTLEPIEQIQIDDGHYDALGNLDVMLPNGQMVPATLVRNASGRIVPLVDVTKTMPYRGANNVKTFNHKPPALTSFSASNSPAKIPGRNKPPRNNHFV